MPELAELTPYQFLSPALVLEAVEALCGKTTGYAFALNSYENRVYAVELESGEQVVVKFYRPNRWSDAQILEEHAFAFELEEAEVPVVAPLKFDGDSLFELEGFNYAIYPKRGGRAFDIKTDEDLRQLGRLSARIHNVGSQYKFAERIQLTPYTYGWDNLSYIRQSQFLPQDLLPAYDAITSQLLKRITEIWNNESFSMRLHGDCHLGNILVDQEPFFVDLDDSLTGPEIQDLWMFCSGQGKELSHQLGLVLEGYTEMRDFDYTQLRLVECLRSLRMIHHSAWLARRWQDPTFPKNFPYFVEGNYWQRQILDLKEQLSLIEEPILVGV